MVPPGYRSAVFKTNVMKARELKKILNNTGYTVAFYGEYIGIGSPLCHDLIKLEISTDKLTYALDRRNGRAAVLHHEELTFIWDKLQELIDNGGIADIFNGQDEIENPLPVYTIRDGELISTFTDAYGWPNVTIDGYLMHDNTYFKTASEAIQYGIKEYVSTVGYLKERLAEAIDKVTEIEDKIIEHKTSILHLKSLLKDHA